MGSADEDLERTERESWRLIDSIPGPIVTLTNTGDVDMVNRHLLEYFGTTIEKARQWGSNDLVHPEDLPQLIAYSGDADHQFRFDGDHYSE
jgi:hypothetical protein